MKDALGGSMLLNLVLIFTGLIIIFFIGILSYSKAYKIKNRIIEIIEKYEVYEHTDDNIVNDVVDELNSDLNLSGYDSTSPTKCGKIYNRLIESKYDVEKLSRNLNNYGYNYCIYEVCDEKKEGKCIDPNGKYYVVVTFIQFDFPIIDSVFSFSVYGEKKRLGKNYGY